jgi:glycosyltransferase involved in cell wall biosynthesis
MTGLKVALIGVYPPPYGGISVHIQRLLTGCRENDMHCSVFDHSRDVKKAEGVFSLRSPRGWFRFLFYGYDVVHTHVSGKAWLVPAVFFFLAKIKGAEYVLSYHSLRVTGKEFGIMGRRLMKMVLKSSSHCIAISGDIKDKLIAMGARPDRISVINAFLPPAVKEEEIAKMPRETRDFMAAHEPVISANAYALVKYRGEDLYGADMCIGLCAALKNDCPGLGLVFCLPRPGDPAYFAGLQRRVSVEHLEQNFLFQTSPSPFYPVLMKSDIFVRPTNTDGDAVSLREALYLKIPSVASDVCPRPAGTVLFKSRDLADFIARVREVWQNYTDYKAKAASAAVPDTLGEILAIYLSVAGERT